MNDYATHPARTRQDEADTKQRLIDGTLAVLAAKGLNGATSREIAAASGVNLGGITYHFGSKDALVAETLLAAMRSWLDPAITALRSDADPVSRMVGAIHALQASFEEATPLLPVYLEALVQATRNPALKQGVDSLFGEIRGFLSQQTAELVAMGFLPAWVQPDSMATLLIATADGIALHAALDPSRVNHAAVADQVVQLLLAARSGPLPGDQA
jgi:AcrR family transcriptional regulator